MYVMCVVKLHEMQKQYACQNHCRSIFEIGNRSGSCVCCIYMYVTSHALTIIGTKPHRVTVLSVAMLSAVEYNMGRFVRHWYIGFVLLPEKSIESTSL